MTCCAWPVLKHQSVHFFPMRSSQALRLPFIDVCGCMSPATVQRFILTGLGHVSGSQDLLSNPLIVPVKILRGHERVNHEGVLGVAFHPSQPWLFTAGADASICLFTNP